MSKFYHIDITTPPVQKPLTTGSGSEKANQTIINYEVGTTRVLFDEEFVKAYYQVERIIDHVD